MTLNRAVAVAMVHGPAAALDLLAALETDDRMAGHHRLAAVRAHCHELDGDHDAAATEYRAAARTATSLPERRYLEARAARLAGTGGPARAAGTAGATGATGAAGAASTTGITGAAGSP